MSIPQAARAIGASLVPNGGGNQSRDGFFHVQGKFKGLDIYVVKGQIQFVQVNEPGIPCERGVKVGDDLTTLVRKVKRLSIDSARYDELCRDAYAEPGYPECFDEIGSQLRPEFKGKTMRFFLDAKGRITWMRAGAQQAVAIDEFEGE